MITILILLAVFVVWVVGVGLIGALSGGDIASGIGAAFWFLIWCGVCAAGAMFVVGRWSAG